MAEQEPLTIELSPLEIDVVRHAARRLGMYAGTPEEVRDAVTFLLGYAAGKLAADDA